jgi:DDE superfamily endonuclease
VLQARRWLPERELVLVTDMGFAALDLLAALSCRGVICITRLRLDAALYEPAPPRHPGTKGRPRSKGARLPNLTEVLKRTSTRWRRVTVPGWYGEGDRVIEFCSAAAVWCHSGKPVVPIRWVLLRDPLGRFSPQALLCTDPKRDPLQIIRWFILRWQIEVTFQEARAHLGVETQRQWSDRAVARTTPCLFGLFSMVTLLAGQLHHQTRTAVWTDSWYRKSRPTFADALAAVRQAIWCETGLLTSQRRHKMPKPSQALRRCLIYALCHAA